MLKLFVCISLIFSISNCQNTLDVTTEKALFQHWVHSYEDETGVGKVYRPSGYDFPRSRGRHGFQLKANGDCKEYAIAPTDGTLLRAAKWRYEGQDIIEIKYPEDKANPLRYQILSVTDTMLTIKVLP
ncbi:MAG: hypothetical protein AB8G15_01165 [Saprospiraceae bacterium]